MSREPSAALLGAADAQMASGHGDPAHDMTHDADTRDGDGRERQMQRQRQRQRQKLRHRESTSPEAIKAARVDSEPSTIASRPRSSPHVFELHPPSSQVSPRDVLAVDNPDRQPRVTTPTHVSNAPARAVNGSHEPDPGKTPNDFFGMLQAASTAVLYVVCTTIY